MKKIILTTAVTLSLVVGGLVLAAPAPKVFVCKYVGTPGVNETLQTGQNPISVSSNAIPNYQGMGSSFADAQGRSFVIAEDTGQPKPTCPTGPTQPPVVPPAQPPVTAPPTTPPSTTSSTPSTVTQPQEFKGK